MEKQQEPEDKKRKHESIIKILITIHRWELYTLFAIITVFILGVFIYRNLYVTSKVEIVDNLAGNIFPSEIISTATTSEPIILSCDSPYVGDPSTLIGVRLKSMQKNTRVRIEVAETSFFKRSISEFILPKSWTEYTVYPDIVWNYSALRNNLQATPFSVVVQVSVDGRSPQQCVRTFSMRSINECLLGYYQLNDNRKRIHFVNTRVLFAAYVNEDNPQIDNILREALNTRLINRFTGYQGDSSLVVRQVYVLWNVLQRRKFKYSSISTSSLSSNVVFAQRVRTFEDAMKSSQINCVDGSVLFASLMRAINIDPILVRLPGHMFVGFYTDKKHMHAKYLETTMIGNIDLDDYFPDEKLDSTLQNFSQNEISHITFKKSMEYAEKKVWKYHKQLKNQSEGYMFFPITADVRRRIQPIGK